MSCERSGGSPQQGPGDDHFDASMFAGAQRSARKLMAEMRRRLVRRVSARADMRAEKRIDFVQHLDPSLRLGQRMIIARKRHQAHVLASAVQRIGHALRLRDRHGGVVRSMHEQHRRTELAYVGDRRNLVQMRAIAGAHAGAPPI